MRVALVLLTLFAGLAATSPAWAGGWYLLTPQNRSLKETMESRPDLHDDWKIAEATLSLQESLSRWVHVRSFDTAAECDAYLNEQPRWIQRVLVKLRLRSPDRITVLDVTEVAPEAIRKEHPQLQSYLRGLQRSHSRCIASDDPRLK